MIFLSYSRSDKPFVDRLSISLLQKDFKVWRDEWRIDYGDSLTTNILAAIDQASLLLLVLSESALASKWVEKEIKAGLMAESKSRPLTVVPLLISECEMPTPLRDRFFVDFRGGFDEPLQKLLNFLGRRNEVHGDHGFHEGSDYFLFHASESGKTGERPFVDFEIVSLDRQERFCVVTLIHCVGATPATSQYFERPGVEPMRTWILQACAREFASNPARVVLKGSDAYQTKFSLEGGDGACQIEVNVRIQRLGAHRNNKVRFNFGALFQQIHGMPDLRQ